MRARNRINKRDHAPRHIFPKGYKMRFIIEMGATITVKIKGGILYLRCLINPQTSHYQAASPALRLVMHANLSC